MALTGSRWLLTNSRRVARAAAAATRLHSCLHSLFPPSVQISLLQRVSTYSSASQRHGGGRHARPAVAGSPRQARHQQPSVGNGRGRGRATGRNRGRGLRNLSNEERKAASEQVRRLRVEARERTTGVQPRPVNTTRPVDGGTGEADVDATLSLHLWRAEAIAVDMAKVTPYRSSLDPTIDARAMLGDTILKGYMLEHMFENEPASKVTDKGFLTEVLTQAVSNRNMRRNAKAVLPPPVLKFLLSIGCSTHEIGTALEAMVYEVGSNPAAVRQVALYLLTRSTMDDETVNWKGLLNQSGFDVDISLRKSTGRDHRLLHTAIANVKFEAGEVSVTAQDYILKNAEKNAARLAIQQLEKAELTEREQKLFHRLTKIRGRVPDVIRTFDVLEDTTTRSGNTDTLELIPLSYHSYHFKRSVHIPDFITPQQWFCSRPSLIAVMNAPYIFPDEIRSVKAWEKDPVGIVFASTSVDDDFLAEETEESQGDDAEPTEDKEDEEEHIYIIRIEGVDGGIEAACGMGRKADAKCQVGADAHAKILEMVARAHRKEEEAEEPLRAEAEEEVPGRAADLTESCGDRGSEEGVAQERGDCDSGNGDDTSDASTSPDVEGDAAAAACGASAEDHAQLVAKLWKCNKQQLISGLRARGIKANSGENKDALVRRATAAALEDPSFLAEL